MYNTLQSGIASAERIFDLLDADEQQPDPQVPVPLDPGGLGRVEFDRVNFAYRPGTPVIEDLSLVAEPGSTRGMQASLTSGGSGRTAYLTDNSPTAETGYHARFAFNANTLTSGATATTALTVFETRTAGNGQVFAVQYRLNAGTRQVRTVLSRSAGGALTGAWGTLGAGSHALQVDWLSGPATGAGAGTLKLSIDGVSRQVQSGNTSTLRVDTARLGITAGASGTSAGAAYFDSFVSTRNTLP